VSIELKEPAVTTFVGMDLHRAQITYDALNTDSGEVRTGRICPANRGTVRESSPRSLPAKPSWRSNRRGGRGDDRLAVHR